MARFGPQRFERAPRAGVTRAPNRWPARAGERRDPARRPSLPELGGAHQEVGALSAGRRAGVVLRAGGERRRRLFDLAALDEQLTEAAPASARARGRPARRSRRPAAARRRATDRCAGEHWRRAAGVHRALSWASARRACRSVRRPRPTRAGRTPPRRRATARAGLVGRERAQLSDEEARRAIDRPPPKSPRRVDQQLAGARHRGQLRRRKLDEERSCSARRHAQPGSARAQTEVKRDAGRGASRVTSGSSRVTSAEASSCA